MKTFFALVMSAALVCLPACRCNKKRKPAAPVVEHTVDIHATETLVLPLSEERESGVMVKEIKWEEADLK